MSWGREQYEAMKRILFVYRPQDSDSGSEVNWFLRFLQTKLSNDFDFWCEVQ